LPSPSHAVSFFILLSLFYLSFLFSLSPSPNLSNLQKRLSHSPSLSLSLPLSLSLSFSLTSEEGALAPFSYLVLYVSEKKTINEILTKRETCCLPQR